LTISSFRKPIDPILDKPLEKAIKKLPPDPLTTFQGDEEFISDFHPK